MITDVKDPDFDLEYLIQATERYEAARDYVLGLKECLLDEWDEEKADHCLEELCDLMRVNVNTNPLTVEARQ